MDMQGQLVVMFHGPDVFDMGYARKLVSAFRKANYYQAGTMGRTAAHDNGLDEVVNIPELPGRVIARSKDMGGLIIAICPRTRMSGKSFVRIILDNAGVDTPVMHLDCNANSYVLWQGEFGNDVMDTIRELGFSEDGPIGRIDQYEQNGKRLTRHMQDCIVGDFVLCNNIVIGKAITNDVSITTLDGIIVETTGLDVKEHGIEKMKYFGKLDLKRTKCCTTSNLRENCVEPRLSRVSGDGVVFINHAGADVYELSEGCEGAVVVGDDTSRIVGDILHRFGIPVIAITDGDKDGLIGRYSFFERSMLFVVDHDDDVGMDVYNTIFGGKDRIDAPFNNVRSMVHSHIADRILSVREY